MFLRRWQKHFSRYQVPRRGGSFLLFFLGYALSGPVIWRKYLHYIIYVEGDNIMLLQLGTCGIWGGFKDGWEARAGPGVYLCAVDYVGT